MNRFSALASVILALSLIVLGMPVSLSEGLDPSALSYDDTVIVTNADDFVFLNDFSHFLDMLKCQWHVLESPQLPNSLHDMNIIIVSQQDSEKTWELVKSIISTEELEGEPSIIEKTSPWNPEKTLILCIGGEKVQMKRAVEDLFYSIFEKVQSSQWLEDPYVSYSFSEIRTYLSEIMYDPGNDELSKDLMIMDMGAIRPPSISSEAAREDVNYLFSVLEHGYSGYGYFSPADKWGTAKDNILAALELQSEWGAAELSELIHENLDFVQDCHMSIGDCGCCNKKTFLFDDELEVWHSEGYFHFELEGSVYTINSIDDSPPEGFMFPSLNEDGHPIYRIGSLSTEGSLSLSLVASNDDGAVTVDLDLRGSAFYGRETFSEDRVGGIPVIRIRSFGDTHQDELNEFLNTAQKYGDEPYLIIDIRDNHGGNTTWPKNWVMRYSGSMPSGVLTWSELTSKTSMVGRYNYTRYVLENYSGMDEDFYNTKLNEYDSSSDSFESTSKMPYWDSLYIPQISKISNDATIIVVMDKGVASAGEGFISYLKQMENVVFIGENTLGALTFGQISYHQLPNSKIDLVVPISLNIFVDKMFREEMGFQPDIWVPSPDALNYAVAAARNGIIGTALEVPNDYFDVEFSPEDYSKDELDMPRQIMIAAIGVWIVVIIANIARKKRKR